MSQPSYSPAHRAGDTASPKRWYLAYTKPRPKHIALSNLELQSFGAYLPVYKKFKPSAQGPVYLFEILGRPTVIQVERHQVAVQS